MTASNVLAWGLVIPLVVVACGGAILLLGYWTVVFKNYVRNWWK